MTSLCECGHPWSRHTSGGMCAGDPPDGSECYCVLFAPDQRCRLPLSTLGGDSETLICAMEKGHEGPHGARVLAISRATGLPKQREVGATRNKALQQVSSSAETFDDKHAAPEFHGQPADEWAAEWRDYWERDGQILVNRRALQGLLSQIDKGGFLRGSYDLGTYWAYGGDGIPCSWLESRYSETPAKSDKTSFLPANLAEQIRVAANAAQDDLLFERMEELGERLSLIRSLVENHA